MARFRAPTSNAADMEERERRHVVKLLIMLQRHNVGKVQQRIEKLGGRFQW